MSSANTKITPKASAGVRWTETEVKKLIEFWDTDLSNAQIAKHLGREESAIAVKASRINLPRRAKKAEDASAPPSKSKIRPCLRCRTNFFSSGPGNRFCDPCKSSSEWQNGNDYYAVIGGI